MSSPELSKRQQIAESIGQRIIRGEWKKGERLPGTKAFAEEYEVSDETIYHAFAILVFRGLVRGVRGGRYVA